MLSPCSPFNLRSPSLPPWPPLPLQVFRALRRHHHPFRARPDHPSLLTKGIAPRLAVRRAVTAQTTAAGHHRTKSREFVARRSTCPAPGVGAGGLGGGDNIYNTLLRSRTCERVAWRRHPDPKNNSLHRCKRDTNAPRTRNSRATGRLGRVPPSFPSSFSWARRPAPRHASPWHGLEAAWPLATHAARGNER